MDHASSSLRVLMYIGSRQAIGAQHLRPRIGKARVSIGTVVDVDVMLDIVGQADIGVCGRIEPGGLGALRVLCSEMVERGHGPAGLLIVVLPSAPIQLP